MSECRLKKNHKQKMTKCMALSILVVASLLVTGGETLTAEDIDSIKISLLPESETPLLVSDKDKPILRYGFHRTHDCQNFDKAFICVRKCLDLNYHIAHADKDCVCTCYKNSILAKFKAPIDTASTKWKLGAPTTSRPPWAGAIVEKKPNDYEINANYTEFIDENKDSNSEPAEYAPEILAEGEGDGISPGDEGHIGEGSGNAGEPPGDAEENHDAAETHHDAAEEHHDAAEEHHDAAEEHHDAAEEHHDAAEEHHDAAEEHHDAAEENSDAAAEPEHAPEE